MFDTHENGLVFALGRGILYDLIGTTVNYLLGCLFVEEPTSGITTVVRSKGTPGLLEVISVGGVVVIHVVGGALGCDQVAGFCTIQDGADGGQSHGNNDKAASEPLQGIWDAGPW